nr:bifunctional solanapyrone synthase [Quercus suber]
MVCDNVDEYEIVLANGSITLATSSQHADLWRALKGGTGNFGIVTRVTARTFPTGKVWAGTTFWTGWQTHAVLKAFFDFNKPENFDEYAAGPILAICYVQSLGVKLVANTLVYTKPEPWAPVFKGFKSLWRLWSTARVQSLTDSSLHLAGMAPSGQRQFQATTTVLNDLDTFSAFNEIYSKKLEDGKRARGSIWSLIFQPLTAAVTHRGSPNVLGLESRHPNDTVIIVLVAVSWIDSEDDELVRRVAGDIITTGDQMAQSKGTADRYRYLNYAASDQDPIGSYGWANKQHLQTSQSLAVLNHEEDVDHIALAGSDRRSILRSSRTRNAAQGAVCMVLSYISRIRDARLGGGAMVQTIALSPFSSLEHDRNAFRCWRSQYPSDDYRRTA